MAPQYTKFLRLAIYSYLHSLEFVFRKATKLSTGERLAILTSNLVAEEKVIRLSFFRIVEAESLKGLDYLIEYSTDLTVNMIDLVETYENCEEHLIKILDLAAKNQNSLKLRLAIDYSKQNVR